MTSLPPIPTMMDYIFDDDGKPVCPECGAHGTLTAFRRDDEFCTRTGCTACGVMYRYSRSRGIWMKDLTKPVFG